MITKSWQVITLINIFTCSGKKFEGKVVGGGPAVIYQFPHAVYLAATCGDASWGCGSSILTDTILLSAAHCLEDCESKFHVDAYAGTDDVEHVGIFQKYVVSGKVNYMRRVKQYILHERYDPKSVVCDIALLKLKSSLVLGETTKRVIIRRSFPLLCEAQMAGWGDINDDGEETFHLKRVRQIVRPSPRCGNRGRNLKVRSGMMCASSDSPDDYPASGDSGSALVMADSQQIGIVSVKAQGHHISSVIYTNVSFYYDWIVHKSDVLHCTKITHHEFKARL